MAGVWKRDGTVAVTNGSKKVTGTGTTFADAKNGVAKGHLFCMTTGTTVDLYEVDYVVSNTELHLVQAFRGTTGTGKAYEIITTFSDSIPEFARKLNASLSYYQSQSDMVQQLFTSDAAEITVTAPDGTTHKLIPWKRVTSEGEGQAARAKVEADRAKNEADRSGTEADRAAGIVAAAALPLPDVWAPLSDSLRLITGYGREVKVGDDVVARMVNFSRASTATYIGKDGQLKTAAANEPRFEKEGLLIEGQSTNVIQSSEGAVYSPGLVGFQTIANGISGVLPVVGQRISFLANAGEVNAGLVQYLTAAPGGQTYTYSCFIKFEFGAAPQTPEMALGVYSSAGTSSMTRATVRNLGGGVYRVSLTFTLGGSGSQPLYLRIIRAGLASEQWVAVVGGVQLETLPFASSYIPTAGAAVTRAGDVCSLPASGNWPNGDFVIAATLSYIKGLVENPILFVSGKDTPTPGFINTFLRDTNAPPDNRLAWYGAATSFLATSGALSTAVFRNRSGMRDIVYDGEILSMGAGGQNTGVPAVRIYLGSYGPFQFLNGHLRNLRIWHRALTDEQIKAVA